MITGMWKHWELVTLVGYHKLLHKDLYADIVSKATGRSAKACKAKLKGLEHYKHRLMGPGFLSGIRAEVNTLIKEKKFELYAKTKGIMTIINESNNELPTISSIALHPHWLFLAKDRTGSWFAFKVLPYIGADNILWIVDGGVSNCVELSSKLFFLPDIPWKDSLHVYMSGKWVKHLKVDTKVEIIISSMWFRAHFSHYDEHGNVVVFADGKTSFTGGEYFDTAKSWRLFVE